MKYKNEFNLEKFYNYSLDLFSVQRLDGTVISVNPSFERILGWKEKELLGKNPFDLLHPDDLEIVNEFAKLSGGVPRNAMQNRIRCADGTYKCFSWTAYPDLEAGLVYVTGRDITEIVESNQKITKLAADLKEANETLFEQACTDPLTKLKNRRAFNEALNFLVEISGKVESSLSLMMIDADHFKNYNDRFGHPAGDSVLTQLAKILMETFRENDIVGRYGGEEFIVALPNTSKNESIQVAERLIQTVRKFPWEKREITVSIGIATRTTSLRKSDTKEKNAERIHPVCLIEEADKALYVSKASGRDKFTHNSDITIDRAGNTLDALLPFQVSFP